MGLLGVLDLLFNKKSLDEQFEDLYLKSFNVFLEILSSLKQDLIIYPKRAQKDNQCLMQMSLEGNNCTAWMFKTFNDCSIFLDTEGRLLQAVINYGSGSVEHESLKVIFDSHTSIDQLEKKFQFYLIVFSSLIHHSISLNGNEIKKRKFIKKIKEIGAVYDDLYEISTES